MLRAGGALAATAVIAAAAGCSSSGGSGSISGNSTTSSSPVTVGLLFPYSGPAASYGALFNKAVQAGMDVVNPAAAELPAGILRRIFGEYRLHPVGFQDFSWPSA